MGRLKVLADIRPLIVEVSVVWVGSRISCQTTVAKIPDLLPRHFAVGVREARGC